MHPHEEAQGRLIEPDPVAFVANVSWRPGEGWRLWVASWQKWESPSNGRASTYEHLTADELIDVLQAEQLSRCSWLRDPLSP